MNIEFPAIDSDPGLWLSVLADNELDSRQRQQLIQFLDAHPEFWRDCGIALMDQQTWTQTLSPPADSLLADPSAEATKVATNNSSFAARGLSLLAVAALVVGLVAGVAIGEVRSRKQTRDLTASIQESNENTRLLSEFLLARRSSETSLYSLYPEKPILVEIENSDDRAMYLTDRPVSDAMLETFLAAGHRVEIKPWAPRLQTRRLQSLENPVLAVEIEKYNPQLIAQGDIK